MRDTPFFSHFFLDPQFYRELALKIAGGQPFPEGIFWYHPLYPYFLAACMKLLGPGLLWIRVVQSAVGAASCVLVYDIGKRTFGRETGILAGILAATYGFFIFSEFTLESEFLAVFFCLASLACLVRLERAGRPRAILALAGGFSGLFMLTRANTVPAFVAAWLVLRRKDRKEGLIHAAIFLAGVAAVFAPFTWEIWRETGKFVLIGGHGGVNFFIGNSPFTDGSYPNVPFISNNPWKEQADYARFASNLAGRSMGYFEASEFLFGHTLRQIAGDPPAYLYLLGKKLWLFFRAYEIPDNLMNYPFVRERYSTLLRVLPFEWGAVAALGLVGMALAWRQKKRPTVLYVYAAGYVLFLIQFFIRARYRLPVIPVFMIFAAFAAARIAAMVRARERGGYAALLAFLAGTLAFSAGVDSRRHYADQHYNLAMIAYEEKNPDLEQAEYERALQSDPSHARSLENLGVLAIEKGQFDRAETLFDRARRLPNPSAKAWAVWGSLRERAGDREGARLGREKALEIDPSIAHNA